MKLSDENQKWYRENDRNYISASGRVFLSDCVYEKLLEMQQRIQELETAEKKAFWWSAEFTHVVHEGKIQKAWEDYKGSK